MLSQYRHIFFFKSVNITMFENSLAVQIHDMLQTSHSKFDDSETNTFYRILPLSLKGGLKQVIKLHLS